MMSDRILRKKNEKLNLKRFFLSSKQMEFESLNCIAHADVKSFLDNEFSSFRSIQGKLLYNR